MSNEPPRPQTASDFRQSLPSGDFRMKSKMNNVMSKSVDFDEALGAALGSSSEDSATRYVLLTDQKSPTFENSINHEVFLLC